MYGVETITPRPSGYDNDKYEQLINHKFNERYKKFESANAKQYCYNYLKQRPKCHAYAKSQDKNDIKKHGRPNGKKEEHYKVKRQNCSNGKTIP